MLKWHYFEWVFLFSKPTGDAFAYISLDSLLNQEKGFARIEVGRSYYGNVYVHLIYQEFYEPSNNNEYPRYTNISIASSDENQQIQPLIDKLLTLIEKYKNMPYVCIQDYKVCVSGTTRV